MQAISNILVIRLSSLGDVLMNLPAVKALKDARPDASVSWLVEGPVAELLSSQPFIDRVIPFPRSALQGSLREGKVLRVLALLAAFVRTLKDRRYDVIADFHGIAKSALLSRLARGQVRVGFDRQFAKEGSRHAYQRRISAPERRIHKVERNMLLARDLGANGAIPPVHLSVPEGAEAYIDAFFRTRAIASPVIVINPFCSRGSAYKRWDLANYGELIKKLKKTLGVTLMILWGPGEEDEARRLEEMAKGDAILACPTTVAQLAAILKRVNLYVGGDTGVMHLAVFAGIPVLAIFGPSDDRINRPFGEGHRVVRKNLECSPCRDKSCKERKCLTSITVDEVLSEALSLSKEIGIG